MALLWNQATRKHQSEFISYWNSGVLAAPDNHLTFPRRALTFTQNSGAVWETGDVTIIGRW